MRMKSEIWTAALMMLVGVISVQCGKTNASRIVGSLPAGIDLASAQKVEIQDSAGQVVLNGIFANHRAPLASTDPNVKAEGLAELEIEKVGTGLKQEIEAKVEDLPAGASFRLVVDGKEIATFMTSSDGKRAMKFTRKDGG